MFSHTHMRTVPGLNCTSKGKQTSRLVPVQSLTYSASCCLPRIIFFMPVCPSHVWLFNAHFQLPLSIITSRVAQNGLWRTGLTVCCHRTMSRWFCKRRECPRPVGALQTCSLRCSSKPQAHAIHQTQPMLELDNTVTRYFSYRSTDSSVQPC